MLVSIHLPFTKYYTFDCCRNCWRLNLLQRKKHELLSCDCVYTQVYIASSIIHIVNNKNALYRTFSLSSSVNVQTSRKLCSFWLVWENKKKIFDNNTIEFHIRIMYYKLCRCTWANGWTKFTKIRGAILCRNNGQSYILYGIPMMGINSLVEKKLVWLFWAYK